MILKKYIRFEARSRSIYFNKVQSRIFFPMGGGGGVSPKEIGKGVWVAYF